MKESERVSLFLFSRPSDLVHLFGEKMDSPLAVVKERFGDKAKLVAEVEKLAGEDLWVSRTHKEKGLARVSNAKLLRLHRIFTEVKRQFGTRDKLIDAILELEKRTKDDGYRARLAKFPVPRLFDLYRTTAKRLGAAPPLRHTSMPRKRKSRRRKKPKQKPRPRPLGTKRRSRNRARAERRPLRLRRKNLHQKRSPPRNPKNPTRPDRWARKTSRCSASTTI